MSKKTQQLSEIEIDIEFLESFESTELHLNDQLTYNLNFQYGLARPGNPAEINWQHWLQLPEWTPWQAVCLIFSHDPNLFDRSQGQGLMLETLQRAEFKGNMPPHQWRAFGLKEKLPLSRVLRDDGEYQKYVNAAGFSEQAFAEVNSAKSEGEVDFDNAGNHTQIDKPISLAVFNNIVGSEQMLALKEDYEINETGIFAIPPESALTESEIIEYQRNAQDMSIRFPCSYADLKTCVKNHAKLSQVLGKNVIEN